MMRKLKNRQATLAAGLVVASVCLLVILQRAAFAAASDAPPVAAANSPGAANIAAAASTLQPPGNQVVTNQIPAHPVPPFLKDGYWVVGYDTLSSFKAGTVLAPEGPKLVGTIPEDIKALDGKSVCVRGFMMPVQADVKGVTECLLLKNQSMCCFGKQPFINEWMVVRMLPDVHLKRIMDVPISIFGKLHVGEYRENGRLRAIYKLDGEKMEAPKSL